jgi:NAD(P)-dependent dehydrogenase (short-subunit alcohol dehydrogenase family)
VLVNNAGTTGGAPQPPTTVDPATVRAAVETNVISVIRVTNAMPPLLRRSASPRIVNISSSVGSVTLRTTPGADTGPMAAAYVPSKTFLSSVTVQYAKEPDDTNTPQRGLPRLHRDQPQRLPRRPRPGTERGDRDPARRRPDRRVPQRRLHTGGVLVTYPAAITPA